MKYILLIVVGAMGYCPARENGAGCFLHNKKRLNRYLAVSCFSGLLALL